jgi:hypothetical protein
MIGNSSGFEEAVIWTSDIKRSQRPAASESEHVFSRLSGPDVRTLLEPKVDICSMAPASGEDVAGSRAAKV